MRALTTEEMRALKPGQVVLIDRGDGIKRPHKVYAVAPGKSKDLDVEIIEFEFEEIRTPESAAYDKALAMGYMRELFGDDES